MDETPIRRWDEMAAEVAYALAYDVQTRLDYFDADQVLIPTDALRSDPTKVDVRRRFLRMFDSERDFVRRVWGAVAPMLDRAADRGLVVLFDIDQTLGSRKGKAGESATLIRPAAPMLMHQLQGAGVLMGIITSRGVTDLRSNLADELHLAKIEPYLDERLLTAMGMDEYGPGVTATGAEVELEMYERFRHLLAGPYSDLESFRAWRDDRDRPLPAKDLDKLLQLAMIAATEPGRSYVVIDDRDYASLLTGPQVFGVHLAEHERAHY